MDICKSNNESKTLAIIGIGCRFPGNVDSPDDYWQLLVNQTDAVVDIPSSRFDSRLYYDEDVEKPGKIYVKQGGFLQTDIQFFDPSFFNITPREAMTLDPQQRLLLEVAWEAIEDAGLVLEDLKKQKVGVFIGGFCLDSQLIQLNPDNKQQINSFTASSMTMTVLANRLSHVFDFTGPSLAVDTACSSSLVALHLAAQSLQTGDCDIALVGGVNVIMHPEYYVSMCKGGYLSRQGRCFAFDKRADGYIRGEGCGIVILKHLQNAKQDQDRIYAQLLSSGINQDGHTSGIAMPNPKAQQQLIEMVYKKANVTTNQIHYVEAHGTGTQQGDIAEATALDLVFKECDHKILVGSVKTNIGHLEAAAGIAGLIKTCLCLYHRKAPANLHFETPNPAIPFDKMSIEIVTQLTDLPETAYAGVNSFGYGGTNAHALLCSNVPPPSNIGVVNWPLQYPISAKNQAALQDNIHQHKSFLSQQTKLDEAQLANIVYSQINRKQHYQHRSVYIAENIMDLKSQFLQLEQKSDLATYFSGQVSNKRIVVTFVYSGMGPQWWGMGRQLLATNRLFADWVTYCDQEFVKIAGWSLLEQMTCTEYHSKMQAANVAQPMNFLLQSGLTKLLQHHNIIPSRFVGHSVGEITAAWASGALSLQDALSLVYHRARLQFNCAGTGGLMAISIEEHKLTEILKAYPSLTIAAINGDSAFTLAGNNQDLEKIANMLSY